MNGARSAGLRAGRVCGVVGRRLGEALRVSGARVVVVVMVVGVHGAS